MPQGNPGGVQKSKFLGFRPRNFEFVLRPSLWLLENLFKIVLSQDLESQPHLLSFCSIFYNNVLFIATLIVFSFLVFPASTPAVNYVASMGLASGLVALLSTGTGNY